MQHYSGSAGNLYELISSNGNRLIIDPGVPWKKIQKALTYDLSNIEGCFCTHFHADHCKGINEITLSGIPTYTSQETIDHTGCDSRVTTAIRNHDLINLDTFQVYVFDTLHDCPGSVAFVVLDKSSKEYLLFVTDSKCVVPRFKQAFSIICLEASYCGETLARKVEAGTIPEALAKRLLTSHQEINTAKEYLRNSCNLSKCHQLHLLHLSSTNTNKDIVRKEFADEFLIETIVI